MRPVRGRSRRSRGASLDATSGGKGGQSASRLTIVTNATTLFTSFSVRAAREDGTERSRTRLYMELPRRSRGDELLKSGEMLALRQRVRQLAPRHDVSSVIACAFDHRTRMLPFIYADTRMVPGGVRAIGSALADVGFHKTRIVLQQWNKRFRPSQMKLDGRVPDLFMVSSMGLHSGRCTEMIRDARRIDPAHRSLIISAGPHAVYQPSTLFSANPADPTSADLT